VKAGDKIVFGKYAGPSEGRRAGPLILREDDILGIVD
jgi:co-chaperonin GroES (HSP10)